MTPYLQFNRSQWAALRDSVPMTLTEGEITRLKGINEDLSLEEVAEIYLPLSRLLNFYISSNLRRQAVLEQFLGTNGQRIPYIISIAGSVAVGKSTTARVLQALLSRWPEHRVAPSLARVAALTELLGDPQRAYPVIQIAGTNGKGSTAIMIESLLLALGLRVGRISSPHLSDVTERVSIDGVPIGIDAFDELVSDVAPLVAMVDDQLLDGVPMTFFDSLVMPQPLMQSMLKVGMRLISRPEGKPRMRHSPEWPPDQMP